MSITLFAPKVDPGVLLRAVTAGSDQAVSHQLHCGELCEEPPGQGAVAAALELVTGCSPLEREGAHLEGGSECPRRLRVRFLSCVERLQGTPAL